MVWVTGLSGAGKSTLCRAANDALLAKGWRTVVLDGDALRQGLCAGLGFSEQDRAENVRRVAEVAKLFGQVGFVVLVALISPMRQARSRARDLIEQAQPPCEFIEVYCDAPLETCQQRDPKGLYAKVAQGLIAEFTGVSAPYEAPTAPQLRLATGTEGPEQSAQRLLSHVVERLTQRLQG